MKLPLNQGAVCLLLASSFQAVGAFYIPGVSFTTYANGDRIPLYVNKVYSDNTQIQYAYADLPFVCDPLGVPFGIEKSKTSLLSGTNLALNLGEVLRGDRITLSDYELTMGKDKGVTLLCTQSVDLWSLVHAREVVSNGYVAEWIVDNLPSATQFISADKKQKYYAAGFKMGYTEMAADGNLKYYINNHNAIVIRYRPAPGKQGEKQKYVIVAFEVYPKSIGLENRDENDLPNNIDDKKAPGMELVWGNNMTMTHRRQAVAEEEYNEDGFYARLSIPYTYSVHFRESKELEWHNRWDPYFVNLEDSASIHWLAIINSLVIAGFLAACVAVIYSRTIRGETKGQDIPLEDARSKHKREKSQSKIDKARLSDPLGQKGGATGAQDEDSFEDVTGWKLVHADVFRQPKSGTVLAPLVGSGMQLMFMFAGLLLLSCLGVLNPSLRGGFISTGIGLYLFASLFAGYWSSRVYRSVGGESWRRNVLVTASFVPGYTMAVLFVLNFFVWGQDSSTAIPLGSFIALLVLWVFVQVPLVYIGSYVGYTRIGAYAHPVRPSTIPRQIPKQALWTGSITSTLLAGLVPFVALFVELMFIFRSIWLEKTGFYYLFGYAAVVTSIVVLTIIEITIVAIYIQLCYENYHWWWHSFFVGGSSSVWIFGYCIWYYFARLSIQGFLSSLLFFSYSFLGCAVYGLLTGAVGFLTAYAFVRRIFATVKVE